MNQIKAHQVIAVFAILVAVAYGETDVSMNDPVTIIDFSDADAGPWSRINDGVMGGVSRSDISRTDQGTGLFTGVLSLENNGGFASVRTSTGGVDLEGRGGLEAKVRGDGRTYQLRLRTDDRFDGVAYRASFATEDGEWITVRIPFTEFEPTYRGRILRDRGPLDPARVRQLGFMLADKTPGPFSLEIAHVRAWTADPETRR